MNPVLLEAIEFAGPTQFVLALQFIVLAGVTLYITMTGYAISTGAIETPFDVFLIQNVKIIVLCALMLLVATPASVLWLGKQILRVLLHPTKHSKKR